MSARERALFLCIGNSCRSQMAEGLLRFHHGARYDVSSAGLRYSKIDPLAVRVMKEAGIDISQQTSKSVEQLQGREFDWVITVCEEGLEECPYFPALKGNLHRAFRDPPKLTAGLPDEELRLPLYREVRDEIERFVLTLPDLLTE